MAQRFNIKLDPATLARLENGQRRVTIDEACLFAVALGVPLGLMLWPVDEPEPVNIAPGVPATPWDAFEWMAGNLGIGVETDDVQPWQRARTPIRLYAEVIRLRGSALRLRTQLFGGEPPDDWDVVMADYLDQLRRLADLIERMETAGFPVEGEGWVLVPPDLTQDLKRLEQQLDEGRFHIGDEREEV